LGYGHGISDFIYRYFYNSFGICHICQTDQ
jgi:hypothetical protein